ncbi:L-serine ammonia-lyase, iron-sulfur-dependent subunit beta [Paenibacillus methanolicus]|uniref:L-serine deaminase n=1 Tax=Paenibacillus methanolicus TaxID=582686 RepID=A0A5S5CMF6_9BACL|nr:L-serine ammonia-lyase, iron-sulfur-dependent subunit beta [Paenibacillus methanolicus]TYP79681.1 L-serine dehydratase [Paenibacillus methanolicus]
MRFKDVFSIIGPAMIGPSSSHTAGAARIGRFARQLFGAAPEEADITFYGSFAATYEGHGTDIAIVGGLLDWQTDDPRIPNSLQIAVEQGIAVAFREGRGAFSHPNTAKLLLRSQSEGQARELAVTGTSIGGGNIEITAIDGFSVKLTGIYPTLVIRHKDWTGVVASVTDVMRRSRTNIAFMSVDRKGRSGDALTVLELDSPITEALIAEIGQIESVSTVHIVNLQEAAADEDGISTNTQEEQP